MQIRAVAALALTMIASGCMYSFVGGGLPSHIRTVAVLPFENTTPQPLLESELEIRMQEAIPRNLGVRLAAQDVADAAVRGRITGYEEVATSVRPTGQGQGNSSVSVPQREVRIRYEAEIYDLREDRVIWTGRSRSVVGSFQTDSESPELGRARAIEELVQTVIEGAQSQW